MGKKKLRKELAYLRTKDLLKGIRIKQLVAEADERSLMLAQANAAVKRGHIEIEEMNRDRALLHDAYLALEQQVAALRAGKPQPAMCKSIIEMLCLREDGQQCVAGTCEWLDDRNCDAGGGQCPMHTSCAPNTCYRMRDLPF